VNLSEIAWDFPSMSNTAPNSTYAFGQFRLVPEKRQLLDANGQNVALRGKIFDLLWYLLQHKGQLISKTELLETLWPDTVVEENNLNQTVSALRHALNDDVKTPQLIATVKGRGYQFIGDVSIDLEAGGSSVGAIELVPKSGAYKWVYPLLAAAIVLSLAMFAFNRSEPLLDRVPEITATDEPPSIAVLPFENRSADEDDVFFVDGIHDDILTSIAKIGSIKVISRTSVEQFREPGRVIPEIAAELGVSAILEGAVQRVGDRVRINVQLIDAATDAHVWAETYDRELTVANIFAIQREVSNEIANAMHAQLTAREKVRIEQVPTENLEAYEAYLLGSQRLQRRTGAMLEEARRYFQKALDLDPEFALAYVGLADSYLILLTYSNKKWDELEPPARAAIERAIELDASLGEAYATLAMINTESGNHDVAGTQFQHAITLSPNYATAFHWSASHFARTGQLQKALEQAKTATRLDPLSPIMRFSLGSYNFRLGQYAEAETQLKKAIEIDPQFARAYWSLSILYHQIFGYLDEAAVLAKKAIDFDSGVPIYPTLLASIYIELGDDTEAERWLAKAAELDTSNINYDATAMFLALRKGDEETAVQISEQHLDVYPQIFSIALPAINAHLAAGRFERAIDILVDRYPELLVEGDNPISNRNFSPAIALINAYQLAGMGEQAQRLLRAASEYIDSSSFRTFPFFQIADVQLLALQGKNTEALATLRQHAESGWRYFTFYYLDYDPILTSIRNDSEFIAITEFIDADIAAQRISLDDILQ